MLNAGQLSNTEKCSVLQQGVHHVFSFQIASATVMLHTQMHLHPTFPVEDLNPEARTSSCGWCTDKPRIVI